MRPSGGRLAEYRAGNVGRGPLLAQGIRLHQTKIYRQHPALLECLLPKASRFFNGMHLPTTAASINRKR